MSGDGSCRRFEEEGLLRLEQGLPLDEHFATCPDCQRERALYERLGREIAALREAGEPPAGWQEKVWQRLAQRPVRRRRPWWWTVPAGLAAAALLATVVARWPSTPSLPTLEIRLEAGTEVVRRGDAVHPGDRLTLLATTGGNPHAELRVYRQDHELVLRCASEAPEPPCTWRGDHLQASLELTAVGRYQPLLLTAAVPLPEPSGDLDGDAGQALAVGARVLLGREVLVQ